MPPLTFERFGLCHGTMASTRPAVFLAAAAAAGFRRVSIRVASPRVPLSEQPFSLLTDSRERREVRALLSDTGLVVTEAEAGLIRPDSNLAALRPTLEAAAHLGAQGILCVFFGQETEEQIAEQVAAVTSLAADFQLRCRVEFLPSSALRSLAAAQRILDTLATDNAGIICDILHLMRSGMTPAEVGCLNTQRIESAQISDNFLDKPLDCEQKFNEAMGGRLFLGDGDFPVRELVSRLPETVPVGLEVLSSEFLRQPRTAAQRAQFCADNIRNYFAL